MAILGHNTIEATAQPPSTQAHLDAFTAPASGLITQLFLYLNANAGSASTYVMGIYADSSGAAGALLGVSNPIVIANGHAAGWVEFDLISSMSVVSGTIYWIGFAENGGGAATVKANTGGHTTGKGSTSTLPNPFGSPGWNLTNSELYSMYAQVGTPVPTVSTAPTISGSSPDGSTLTCTTGSWTNTPTSYAYQWKRAGTNISGAVASTYVLTLADRTSAITCAVTATNGGGDSAPSTSSNSITGTAPTVTAAGRLKYAPRKQASPTTIDLTTTPGNYFATLTGGLDYVIALSATVPRTGIIEIDANGARSVLVIGGLWALNDGGSLNYHLHLHNVASWVFVEGQEADMANTHADFLCLSGGALYRPEVTVQNCRGINLTATDATNHADIFQPQGMVGNVYVDKLTFSSNYQGFTIASDGSTGNTPARSVKLSRVNSWFSSANATNPFTEHYLLNNASNTINGDTAPFPIVFDDVWCDLARGAGRASYTNQVSRAIYPAVPASGSGKAGGGTLQTGGASPFSAGEVIGADDEPGHTYAWFANPKLKACGVLWNGSPSTGRGDVSTDLDGHGSFVPAGIGSNYSTPGYLPRPRIGVAI